MRSLAAIASLALAGPAIAGGNLVLNGDFENNSAGSTQFNLQNTQFTSLMANATAFGSSSELDIVTSTDFGIAPQSGSWKVGLHQNTASPSNVDAFSLALDGGVTAGQSLNLSFYISALSGEPLGQLEFGLSNSPTDFGTQIFTGMATSPTVWTHLTHDFTAPISASYLTISSLTSPDNYAFLDNVTLTPTLGSAAIVALGGLAIARRRR